MTRRRKLFCVGACAGAVGVVAVLLFSTRWRDVQRWVFFSGLRADLRRERLDDLLNAPAAVPHDENGFLVLRSGLSLLDVGERDWWDRTHDAWEDALRGASRTGRAKDDGRNQAERTFVDRVLEKNKAVLDAVERSLSLPEFQIRGVDVCPTLSYDKEVVFGLQDVRELLYLRCARAVHAGRIRHAADDALLLLRYGHAVLHSGGLSVTFRFGGLDSKQSGARILADLGPFLSSEDRRTMIRELERYALDPSAVTATLKEEYLSLTRAIEEVENAKEEKDSLLDASSLPYREQRLADGPLHAREALLYLARVVRFLEDCPAEPHREAFLEKLREGDPSLWLEPPRDPPSPFTQALCSYWIDHWGRTLIDGSREFDFLAARVNLWLVDFRIESGSWPSTLDELVPAYAAEVPRDPFDDKSLRYDAERKLLYSVGSDLEEDGPSESPGSWSGDPTWFLRPRFWVTGDAPPGTAASVSR